MEAAPLRPQLPSLGFVDADKARKEEEVYQARNGVSASQAPSAASTEPAFQYPQGPPPPYSHPAASAAPAALAPTAGPELGTPPDSRRPSGEKDVATQPAKQSLPSISEALGVDNQTTYQTPLPAQAQAQAQAQAHPPPMMPLQSSLHKSHVPSSPVPAMRSYAAEPPISHGPRSSTPKYQPSEPPRPLFPDVRPALHVSTNGPAPYMPGPGSTAYSHTTASSPQYDRGQGPASFAYGYTPYPPRYQSSVSSNAGPIYQPSSVTTAPSWRSDSTRHQERSYGESVKRHLDLYDLESGLNDITSTSSFLGDFAHRYGTLLHQSPRSGPQLSMLPGIIEIEDMISKSRAQTEALIKIRETVLAQQAAHDQEAAEQRQQKAYGSDMIPPHSSGDSDDGKSNYGGSDIKKRRGRAAPPGRCHSCNRAETPEWRRGPDGARTLCNACGLHYAKLTRKQNNAGKPGAINSSNLRPKDLP